MRIFVLGPISPVGSDFRSMRTSQILSHATSWRSRRRRVHRCVLFVLLVACCDMRGDKFKISIQLRHVWFVSRLAPAGINRGARHSAIYSSSHPPSYYYVADPPSPIHCSTTGEAICIHEVDMTMHFILLCIFVQICPNRLLSQLFTGTLDWTPRRSRKLRCSR